MNKSYKYTLLTLFLAIIFAIGSMEGMSIILRIRERWFLSESGRVVMEAPVRAWQEQDSSIEGENKDSSIKEGYALTAEQMEEVIRQWDGRMAVAVHNPVNGQISMAEAVKAGVEWLAEMGMEGNVQEKDMESNFMNAMLGVAVQNPSAEAPLEPYYSYWIMQFSDQSMKAVLYLNAVTGQVWSAEIILLEDLPEEIPYEKLNLFAELSGLQISDTDTVIKNQEGTQAFLVAGGSPLCAEMEFHHSQTGYPYSGYGKEGFPGFEDGTVDRENVSVSFRLAVSKDN